VRGVACCVNGEKGLKKGQHGKGKGGKRVAAGEAKGGGTTAWESFFLGKKADIKGAYLQRWVEL